VGDDQINRARSHASVRDVARLAGVSATTVSRALRGNSYVAVRTRDRVLRAASQLAYSLPQPPHRPTLVVVLVRSPARWFYAEAITGIEGVLTATDHQLVLHNVGDPHGRRLFFEHVVPRGQLDGVVVVSSSFDELESEALAALVSELDLEEQQIRVALGER